MFKIRPNWSWAVLFGSFLAFFIADGWSYTLGMLYPQLLSEFNESRGPTSYIITLLYGVPMILSPLACSAVPKVGCRSLGIFGGVVMCFSILLASFLNSFWSVLLSLGVLTSVGLVAVYVSAYVAVTYWFDDSNRGLATGIAVAGSGLGSVIFPHSIEWLLNWYTWRGMMIIVSGVCLNASVSGFLYRPFPTETKSSSKSIQVKSNSNNKSNIEETGDFLPQNSQNQKESEKTTRCLEILGQIVKSSLPDYTLLKSKIFCLFCIANFILYLWISMPYLYIYDMAEEADIDSTKSTWILSSIGFSRMVGQISIGLFGDKVKISPNLLLGICIIATGIAVFFITFSKLYISIIICCVSFGFFISSTYALPMICMGEVIGMDRAVAGLGLLQFVQGIATLGGTPFGGWMHDSIGNYDATFYISGILIIISGIFLCFIPWLLRFNSRYDVTIHNKESTSKNNDTNVITIE